MKFRTLPDKILVLAPNLSGEPKVPGGESISRFGIVVRPAPVGEGREVLPVLAEGYGAPRDDYLTLLRHILNGKRFSHVTDTWYLRCTLRGDDIEPISWVNELERFFKSPETPSPSHNFVAIEPLEIDLDELLLTPGKSASVGTVSRTARSSVQRQQADEVAQRLQESRLVSDAAVAQEIRAAFEVLPPVPRAQLQAELTGLFKQSGLSIYEHSTFDHVLSVLARCRFLTDESAQRATLREAIAWARQNANELAASGKEQLADAVTRAMRQAGVKAVFEDGTYSTRLVAYSVGESHYIAWRLNTKSRKTLSEKEEFVEKRG